MSSRQETQPTQPATLYSIRPLEEKDIAATANLLNKELGLIPGREKGLKARLLSSGNLLLIAENSNKEIVGFTGAYIGPREEVLKFFAAEQYELAAEVVTSAVAAMLRSLVVHHDYRKCGLGQELHARRMEWLRERGAEQIVGIAWERADVGALIANIVVESGMKMVRRVPRGEGAEIGRAHV